MHFGQKTLKLFSFDLLHDLEISLLDTLEAGVEKDWKKWFTLVNSGILENAKNTAVKNKRSTDFEDFSSFKQNLNFADSIELISSYSSKGNSYFKKFFKTGKEKNLLIQACGETNRFRNIVDHPAGKTIYLTDIREFLKASLIICNILNLSSLGIKFKNCAKDIENSIADSQHFLKDSIEAVYNNLPKPDYEDWYGLVGRNQIKTEILDDFSKGYNRVIAITGGGGIGKSALALDICYEFLKPTNFNFKHIIWITSKNNFLDYSGIKQLKSDYFYTNNYKDFLNQFISGFYQELYTANLDSVSEEELEKELEDIFESYNRILCVVDNLENIDDPKILHFIKNKILPPNYVLITSRKGMGEINKAYKLEPLDVNSAFTLFENLCKSPLYDVRLTGIDVKKIKELLKKTNYYPLVIKWCVSLVSKRKMELEGAFNELNKPQNSLLEFIFQKLYKELSKNSKKILRSLAMYKEIPDRNIISYIAELETEEELMDAIFELEQHSLIIQDRIDSKNGIIETISLLGLAQTFINNISDIDKDLKEKYEKRIIQIEQELDNISNEENCEFRPAQKLAQSKLLHAYRIATEKKYDKKLPQQHIREAERLAPRFYLIPFYRALIEMVDQSYEYGIVKQYFMDSLSTKDDDSRVLYEYARLLKKHKKDSSKEYAPLFYKAFKLANQKAYGIEAGIAFFDSSNYSIAYEIILKIKDIDPDFPKENQHKLWTAKTIMILAEIEILHASQKAIELLNSIESDIDILAQEKTKEYRLLKAKYCSLLSLTYSIAAAPLKAREFLRTSNEIVNIYKSVSMDQLEMRELLCYNTAIDAILCQDVLFKTDKLIRCENELSGMHKNHLIVKFRPLLNYVKRTIQ